MDLYFWLKFAHILGAAILIGTGIGIAFFMFMANRTGDIRLIAGTSRLVVLADTVFTATAAIIQPITGAMLVYHQGYAFSDLWIWLALVLYVVIGLCWLPVVWLQIRMRDLAMAAVRDDTGLGASYHRYIRIWFILGWPAFISILGIIYLMIWKPM